MANTANIRGCFHMPLYLTSPMAMPMIVGITSMQITIIGMIISNMNLVM